MRCLPIFLLVTFISLPIGRAAENPLLRDEVAVIKNPGFEMGFAHWIGAPGKRHEVADRHLVYEISDEAAAGKHALAMQLTKQGDHYLPSPTFTLKRDHRYYLSAKIRTQGNVHASVRPVAGAGGEQFSDWVGPDQGWTEVGVAFMSTGKANVGLPPGEKEIDPSRSYIQLRLSARGQGTAYFDDIRIYETYEYGPYLRVKLLEPAGRKYRVRLHAMVGAPNWYYPRTYFEEGIEPGEFSGWIKLGRAKEFLGSRLNSAGIHFEPLAGEPFASVKAEIEFASSPKLKDDEAAKKPDVADSLLDLDDDPLKATKNKPASPKDKQLYTKLKEDAQPEVAVLVQRKTYETPGHVVGLFIPSATTSPHEFAKGLRPLAEDIRMRNEHVRSLDLPPVKLDHYYVEAHHKGFEHFFSDPELLAVEVDTLRRIGFSALDTQYAGLAGVYRELAEKAGLAQTHQTTVGHTLIEDPATGKAPFDEAQLRKQIAEKVAAWFARMKKDDPRQFDRIRFFVLCDEIWGVSFGGPDYEQGYRDYLKQHGITPEQLGKSDAGQIKNEASWWWRDSWERRPQDRSDMYACRDYYWRLRYWSWATARAYGMITEEIHKHLPGVPTVVNHGLPWAYGYDGYMRGVEVFEFARQNALTAFLHEDWLNTSGWRHSGIQLCGYLADFSRSIGKVNGAPAYAYVMPARKEPIQLKLAAVVGKGVKVLDLYRYGPAYGSPDNWSQNLPQVQGVAQFLRQLDQAEDVLADAQPRPAQTAIIWSAANEVWRETDASLYDRQLIYLALQHRQIPIDFVDEFRIEDGGLADYRVAYLNARYLRRDAQQAIVDWVKGGGRLWVDALAGTGDEYGQPSDLMTTACGIGNPQVVHSELARFETQHSLPQQKPLGHITYQDAIYQDADGPIEAIGRKVTFDLADAENTQVLATYEDGSPAVIERRLGKGSVYYVGATAGCSYGRPVVREVGRIERGYRDRERRMITDFALASGVERPVRCNIPGVQADLLEGSRGAGIVLANFTGEPQQEIALTVRLNGPINSARCVEHGKLKMDVDEKNQTATIRLPLDLVDFVLLEK